MQISPQKFSGSFIEFVFILAIVVTCPSASRLKQQSMEPGPVLAAQRCSSNKAEAKEMNRLNGRKDDKQMATSPGFCRRQTPPTSTTVRRPG
ncbi:MAG TPA: hypothetical protein VGJ21_24680 [Terracidiphilus sp.]|jgi:hypothetical protein